jgi:hypothetical protein
LAQAAPSSMTAPATSVHARSCPIDGSFNFDRNCASISRGCSHVVNHRCQRRKKRTKGRSGMTKHSHLACKSPGLFVKSDQASTSLEQVWRQHVMTFRTNHRLRSHVYQRPPRRNSRTDCKCDRISFRPATLAFPGSCVQSSFRTTLSYESFVVLFSPRFGRNLPFIAPFQRTCASSKSRAQK